MLLQPVFVMLVIKNILTKNIRPAWLDLNVSFSENFADVLNQWSPDRPFQKRIRDPVKDLDASVWEVIPL